MPEEQTTLITILNEVISKYDNKIKDLIAHNNSVLLLNNGQFSDLKTNIYAICDMELETIQAVFIELNENNPQEEKAIINQLGIIKILLTLNKTQNTTYVLSPEQLQYIDLFLQKVATLAQQNKIKHEENIRKISKIENISSKYRSLLKKLEDKENKEFIKDFSTIDLLLNEYQSQEEIKRSILISIMKYNASRT